MIMLNDVYCIDCIEFMQTLPDGYINLTVTSPPYNVDLGNKNNDGNQYDMYYDNIEYDMYLYWLKSVFAVLYTKTAPDGRLCINIGDQQNGRIPLHSDLLQICKDIGWKPFTSIIWDKGHTSARTAWGSWLSPSCPSFPKSYEYILVFYKGNEKLIKNHDSKSDLERNEFIDWAFGIWKFGGEKKKNSNHPAAFPVELPKRCIKMFSWINDIVFDPFCGSGTTCVVAKQLNRKYIGTDISENYIKVAKKRIDVEIIYDKKFF